MHAGRAIVVLLFCLLLILSLPVTVTSATPGQESTDDVPTRVSIIVVFQNRAAVNASLITQMGGTVTGGHRVDTLPVLFAEVNRSTLPILEQQNEVESVALDRTVTTTARPQTATHNQTVPWGVARINASAPATALNERRKANISVAVLDTGVAYRHEDLNESVVWGVSTVGNGSIEYGRAAADDTDGHGTHVAGTIAAANNDYGVVGVAPGVELYAVQVLNQTGGGSFSDLIEGIDQALKGPDHTLNTSDDADILSLSLGAVSDSPALEQTVEDATNRSIMVAAAGNSGDGDPSTDNVSYPARYDDVIAVGATDQSDTVPNYSSDGPAVEVAAPGDSILSTAPGDTYAYSSGTSMATPHVSGTIALMLANDGQTGGSVSPASIRKRLHDTAIDLPPAGRDRYSGYGLVQTDTAVRNTIPLVLTANATRIHPNESVAFTTTRADTTNRVNATLLINGTTIRTTENGTAIYRFTQNGTFTVTAIKSSTALESYAAANLSVIVSNESLASAYDVNDNNKLDLIEIQRAIRDWAAGTLTLAEIQSLISTWARATAV